MHHTTPSTSITKVNQTTHAVAITYGICLLFWLTTASFTFAALTPTDQELPPPPTAPIPSGDTAAPAPTGTTSDTSSARDANAPATNQPAVEFSNPQSNATIREQFRGTLSDRVRERITNLSANMSNRIDALIERFENISVRLESRIEKLSGNGVDTTAARTALAEARGATSRAKSAISTIDTEVATALSAADPRAAWQSVRTIFQTTRTELTAAHQSLRATIAALTTARANAESANIEVVTPSES